MIRRPEYISAALSQPLNLNVNSKLLGISTQKPGKNCCLNVNSYIINRYLFRNRLLPENAEKILFYGMNLNSISTPTWMLPKPVNPLDAPPVENDDASDDSDVVALSD